MNECKLFIPEIELALHMLQVSNELQNNLRCNFLQNIRNSDKSKINSQLKVINMSLLIN